MGNLGLISLIKKITYLFEMFEHDGAQQVNQSNTIKFSPKIPLLAQVWPDLAQIYGTLYPLIHFKGFIEKIEACWGTIVRQKQQSTTYITFEHFKFT